MFRTFKISTMKLISHCGSVMDEIKLNSLVEQFLQDLGGAFSVPLVQIGEQLGLYKALSEAGPSTVDEIAQSTGVAERYMREWLCAQAASNYVSYDADTDKFWMTPEQVYLLADEDSPFYLAPAFGAAATFQKNECWLWAWNYHRNHGSGISPLRICWF